MMPEYVRTPSWLAVWNTSSSTYNHSVLSYAGYGYEDGQVRRKLSTSLLKITGGSQSYDDDNLTTELAGRPRVMVTQKNGKGSRELREVW